MWSLIDRNLPQATADCRFWWRTTGLPLAILLEKAGYTLEAQCQNLFFFYCCVVPELGGGPDAQGLPRSWKSFMTDHFSPIELSCEWGCGGESPTVRFSVEPIGPYAGTPADPLNEHATARLVRRYQPLLSNSELTLFDHFSKELLSYNHSRNEASGMMEDHGHKSRTFVAFDLGKDGVMLKAYFLPAFRAGELGQSIWYIIARAIRSLPGYSPSKFSGLSMLQSFLSNNPYGSKLKAEIFAIDCVTPIRSRLKIYMRSQSTSFDSVINVMTLGGVLNGLDLNEGLNELQRLWKLVLSQNEGFSEIVDLQQRNHLTAGMLYYFDIKQGEALPGVKVYIPVRHYGRNDLAVAEGLETYLKSRGQSSLATKYKQALSSICPPSSLRSRTGIQTYIGCSIVGRELKLTSYLAPKVYNV